MKKQKTVSIRYTSKSLQVARFEAKIGRKRLAEYMDISKRDIMRFENGREILPPEVLTKLFAAGIKLLEQEPKE